MVLFLPSVFSNQETQNSIEGLWRVINKEYRTGCKPESRFWNPGDDPHSIIKIDKPHLSDSSVWELITNKTLGQLLAKATKAKYIQIWHTQVVWKPHSKNEKGNAGWHRDSQYWPFWSKEGLYTAWIALTDVSISSGPVRFIRGSNLWETVQGMDFFNQDIKSQEKILNKLKKIKILYPLHYVQVKLVFTVLKLIIHLGKLRKANHELEWLFILEQINLKE